MSSPDDIIVIKDLYKHFGEVKALDGVSLTVERGKVVVVIGPSGSGKSTMLRCINHLETPTSGEIWIDGELLSGDQKHLNEVRAEIGMVFQLFNLAFGEHVGLGNNIAARIVANGIKLHRGRGQHRHGYNGHGNYNLNRRKTFLVIAVHTLRSSIYSIHYHYCTLK